MDEHCDICAEDQRGCEEANFTDAPETEMALFLCGPCKAWGDRLLSAHS